MQVVVWIIIILIAILIVWLLRKWIKRLIFILILLCLAFFIYWLFSPSWASRLWYNVRTFPQRVVSWISDKKEFLDYDGYKLNISDVWAKISSENNSETVRDSGNESVDNNVQNESKEKKVSDDDTWKDYSWGSKFSNNDSEKKESTNIIPWYSKDDLLGIVTKYVENNLDDDTDILVTIEYEDDVTNPDKIILRTQTKAENDLHFVSIPRLSIKNVFNWLQKAKTQMITVVSWNIDEVKLERVKVEESKIVTEKKNVNPSVSSNKVTSNWLSQNDVREAEELFWILF